MSLFIDEHFNTPGALTTPWNDRPTVEIEDGNSYPATLALNTIVVDGALTLDGESRILLEHDTPPPADYFVEVTVRVDPYVDASAYPTIMLRASVGTYAPMPDEMNAVFVEFGAGPIGTASVQSKNIWYGGSNGGFFDSNWWVAVTDVTFANVGERNIKFRVEIVGTAIAAYINGVLAGYGNYASGSYDPTAFAVIDAGDRLFILDWDDVGHITSIHAGTMPEDGDFWTAFVKTTERAG